MIIGHNEDYANSGTCEKKDRYPGSFLNKIDNPNGYC